MEHYPGLTNGIFFGMGLGIIKNLAFRGGFGFWGVRDRIPCSGIIRLLLFLFWLGRLGPHFFFVLVTMAL
jgi:hypothetical protein